MELLTVKDVCRILHITSNTLIAWRKNSLFPQPLQLVKGRKLLWLRSDIENFIKGVKK